MTEEVGRQRLGWADMALVILFLLGIYQSILVQVSKAVPFPAASAGIVGMILLWRRRDSILPRHFGAFVLVLLLFLVSILLAPDPAFLAKRFTGFVQISYSLVLAYVFYLTLVQASREQFAGLFFGATVLIAVGCLLESYGGLRSISDQVRLMIYDSGVYDADLRDELLYGRVRPKLFTSEPSIVTFMYALFAFAWFVVSARRWKLVAYLATIGVGFFAMPGPTLLLMLALLVPYYLLLSGFDPSIPANSRLMTQTIKIAGVSLVAVATVVAAGNLAFSARIDDIVNGSDASFFYREIGPALAAIHLLPRFPMTGIGLTGETFVANDIINVFARSPDFYTGWKLPDPRELLINYFWQHWIYLGLVWGTIMVVAISYWLRTLGVQRIAFCWAVWVILGQASGAYVGPKTWMVLALAAAATVLYRREPRRVAAPAGLPEPFASYAARRLRIAR